LSTFTIALNRAGIDTQIAVCCNRAKHSTFWLKRNGQPGIRKRNGSKQQVVHFK
jgi:hypothetical protein